VALLGFEVRRSTRRATTRTSTWSGRSSRDRGYKDVVVKDPILETYVVNPREKKPERSGAA